MRMIGHTTYLVFARKVQKLQERLQQESTEGEEEGETEDKEISE
jgi:hypothetical protein